MRFQYIVEVEVERTEGKFASREELAEQIQESLENAQLDSLEGENGGQYDVTDWSVSEQKIAQFKRKTVAKGPALPSISADDLAKIDASLYR